MVDYEQLYDQNDKLTELTNFLTLLLSDRAVCDSQITCDLFFRYIEQVKARLVTTDSALYSELLATSDQRSRNLANRFMGGSREINRIFSTYTKKWCKMSTRQLYIKRYDEFMAETEEMFQMVLDRLQDETEHLYPALRRAAAEKVA